jgi:hypothetical protein
MHVKQRYNPIVLAANATVTLTGDSIGCFLCTTSGTITIKDWKGNTIVNALSVTAGNFYHIPFFLNGNGGKVISASAVGVIGV